MHRTSSAHDWSSDFVWYTIWYPRCVERWASLQPPKPPSLASPFPIRYKWTPELTHNILLISPRNLQTRVQLVPTPLLDACPALLAVVADVPHWLHACAVAEFPAGDLGAEGDDYAGAFVAGGVDAEFLHLLGEGEVV